jgi:hypothetical protein
VRKLSQLLYPERTKREIDEELSFHLDLLADEYFQRSLSTEEARESALARFGNLAQITDECVLIKRRQRPLIRAFKLFFILVFLSGVFTRILAPEYHLTHVGDILMAVGLLGRLWLYARALVPSSFIGKSEDHSPLSLRNDVQSLIAVYDQKQHTPVERVIFRK